MAQMAPKNPSSPDAAARFDDEGSVVRSRSHATSRAAPGSLDERIERKVRFATALARDLPSSDARVRLLHIASMRRDESLLDGVLAELNKLPLRG
jgi:hypothetical protein